MRKELVVYSDISLQKAMAQLEILKNKILFIINQDRQFIGTLTDGDIRRAIINGHQTNENICSFMNSEPSFAYENDSINDKLELFDRSPIRYLAIVDEDKKLINIISKNELGALPNIAILMAGGLGSRLGELTKNIPKPLLKVGSQPILQNIIEQFSLSSIKKFKISVNYKAEMIKEYFSNGEKYEVDIDYIEESKRLGTAGCLSLIEDQIIEPFFVMNGDILVDIDFKDMLAFHKANNCKATMGVVKYKVNIPYGVVEVDNNKTILKLLEKPTKSYYINAGIYILNPEVLEMIPRDEFFDMPTLFNQLQEKKEKVGVYDKLSNWLDIGHIDDYKKAQEIYE